MSELHLTRELLVAMLRRERNPGDVAAVFIAHLERICPSCREEMAAFRQQTFSSQVVFHDFGRRQRRRAEWHRVLPAAATGLPPEEQVALEEGLREAPDRVEALRRAEELLEEARRLLPEQPAEARANAQQAKALLRRHPASSEAIQCYALALAHEGNAYRALGELRTAADLFAAARFVLRSHGGGARHITAELDQLEGSLCRDQRRLQEATALLHRSYLAYILEEDWERALRVLLKLGLVHREAGEITAAITTARQAAAALEDSQSRLTLMAYHNLAYFLADAGDFDEARKTLSAAKQLARSFSDRWTQLRLRWVEGNIARGLGEVAEAEAAYQQVRDGFLQRGVGFDAALVSLDLALLYAQQGRTAEVKRLASEMLPVFQAQDVHREALAALLLFQEAAHAERVTVGFLENLIRYLEVARHNPELAFREG